MSVLANQAVQIVVVDRDLRAGQQIHQTLIDEGYRCCLCSDANEALQTARTTVPALMIVDTDVEQLDGFELVRRVQDESRGQPIPVIFTSDQRRPELVDRSRRAGGFYFLSKPIDPSVLLELVSNALWMPHLVRRHIDSAPHNPALKGPRILSDASRRVDRT